LKCNNPLPRDILKTNKTDGEMLVGICGKVCVYVVYRHFSN
jgi:hypothetical protein